MSQNVSIFAPEIVPDGWFSKEAQADGWFDRDLLDLPSGSGATATGETLSYTHALVAGTATGGASATATGAALTVTATLLSGAASVADTAAGVTLSYATSLIQGAASGQINATATGATLSTAVAIVAGNASGQINATASGVSLPVNVVLLSGNAQGERNASAGGATVLQFYDFTGGAASSETAPIVTVRRGDDAGARRRFWEAKAEEWLQERLEAVQRAAKGPARGRKRLATRIIADMPEFVSELPEFASRVDALERLTAKLLAPQVDYSQIAQAVAAQMAFAEAWATKQRRRRDVEALLMLAA